MAKDLAIVLNSGGMNSAVARALAAQRYLPILLHVPAGSATESGGSQASRSRVAFDQQVAHFKPYREHVLPMPYLSQLASSAGPKPPASASDPRQQAPLSPQMLNLLPLVSA